MYEALHVWCVNYLVTLIAFAAPILQVRAMRARTEPEALSQTGSALQGVVFAMVAISWSLRLQHGTSPFRGAREWYEWVGWATLDNMAFAIIQIIVCWTARRFSKFEKPQE